MKVIMLDTKAVVEVDAVYAARLIEQGKAVKAEEKDDGKTKGRKKARD